MSECTSDCASCSTSCADRKAGPQKAPMNANSKIGKVIAVVSGKGGVGKSMVTGLLATQVQVMGKQVGILDADVTGPSIPKMFGLEKRAVGSELGILPAETKLGLKVMSVNLLLERPEDPVVWRGPVIAGVLQQFWTDVVWGELDVLFIDMPPGTGDVPLTIYQSLPVDGIVVVTTPQDLVGMVVKKAVNMANMMQVPILGMIENLSYFPCPDCGKQHAVFGESKVDAAAAEIGVPVLAKLPIQPNLAALADKGAIELAESAEIDISNII